MKVSIFSSPINISKSLLKPSHNTNLQLFSRTVQASQPYSVHSILFDIEYESFLGYASKQESHVTIRTQR